MRAVVQRVSSAEVRVEGEIIGKINQGLLVFLGIGVDDQEKDVEYLAKKIVKLRIFADQDGKMNLSLEDLQRELLVVSQFTLYADCRKGHRPSFSQAAPKDLALKLYEKFINKVKEYGLRVAAGKFQVLMEISATNDGPVTILLET